MEGRGALAAWPDRSLDVSQDGSRQGEPALVVMHYFPPHIGGMEEVGQAQATSLRRRGHPVTVLTCAHGPGLARHETVDGYRVRRVRAVNVFEKRFGVTFPLVGPLAVLVLLRAMRRASILHIHDVFYVTSHLAFVLARLLGRPYHLTQHVAMVDHPNRLVMGVQRLIYSTIGGAVLRGAETVVVYNARVRDFVVGLGVHPSRVVLHHNGIDTDRFTPVPATDSKREMRARYGLAPERPVVLFVGRLVPKKGFDLVIGASCPQWTTLIVGEGAGPAPEARPGVVFFGPATKEQLVDLYRLSDVFVFPAVGEMFTLVMQEAMAAGVPVITTDDPAYREYDLDRDLIGFVERDPVDIRSAIESVLSSPGWARAMGAYSRRLAVERFSWEANYDHEYAHYRRSSAAAEVAEVQPAETPLLAPAVGR